jgi:hypothetical protein
LAVVNIRYRVSLSRALPLILVSHSYNPCLPSLLRFFIMLSILKTLLILCVFFLHLSSSAVIRRHEEREVQHLTMSVAAPTSLNTLWFPSSLMGRDATDHDDDDDPDDKSDDN